MIQVRVSENKENIYVNTYVYIFIYFLIIDRW